MSRCFRRMPTRCQFCLFDDSGRARDRRASRWRSATGDVFHGAVAGVSRRRALRPARRRAVRRRERGHRFDASKLLADPHAALIDRPFKLHPSMFERGADSARCRAKVDRRRAARRGEPGRAARSLGAHTILYELNLRGFTRLRRRHSRSAARDASRRSPSRRLIDHLNRSASPASRSCRPTPSSTSAICRRSV